MVAWLSALVWLLGCPTEAPVDAAPMDGAPLGAPPGEGGPPPPGGPGGEGGLPGGDLGQAGAAGAPGGTPAQLSVEPGTGVMISGTVSYTGSATGTVKYDMLRKESGNPQLVHQASLEKLGPFSVEVPKGYGEVQLVMYLDVGNDGSSPTDPTTATAWLTVADAPVTDVLLELREFAAAGGAPAAGGTAAPPQAGSAPPEVVPPGMAPGAPPVDGAAPPPPPQ